LPINSFHNAPLYFRAYNMQLIGLVVAVGASAIKVDSKY